MPKKHRDPALDELVELGLSDTRLTLHRLRRGRHRFRDIIRNVRRMLRARGIVFVAGVFEFQPLGCLLLAQAWADGGRHATMPSWVALALKDGRARQVAGVCRECGCREMMACEGGCSWANRERTRACIGRPLRLAKRRKAA